MLVWGIGVAAGALALDRLALWAERRGWIHWRHRRRGAAGTALGPAFEVVHPGHRHVVEARDHRTAAVHRGSLPAGAPPSGGDRSE